MILFGNIIQGLEEYRSTPGAVLLDVRETDEFSTGHIPGATGKPTPDWHYGDFAALVEKAKSGGKL